MNIRDHVFVIGSVINEVVHGKGPETDFQVMDISKCFDKMNFRETFNDLYDNKMDDDHLAVLNETSKTTQFTIKTPVGFTNRKNKNEVIIQGGSWAPLH